MGTRSFVGVMIGDKCRTIYVHYDGYLSGVGAALQHYKTQEEVEELIEKGDRSSLEEGFYRDRGEMGVDPVDFDSFAEFLISADGCGVEYYYIFKDGVWYCGDLYENSPLSRKLTPLDEAMLVRKF